MGGGGYCFLYFCKIKNEREKKERDPSIGNFFKGEEIYVQ